MTKEVSKTITSSSSSSSSSSVRMIVFCEPQRPMEKIQEILSRELGRRQMTMIKMDNTGTSNDDSSSGSSSSSSISSSSSSYNVVTSVLRFEDSTSTRVAAMEAFRGTDTYLGGRIIMESSSNNHKDKEHDHDLHVDTPDSSLASDTSKSAREITLNILITSDLAARGLDIADITHVINYDLPREGDTYVHRGGRAGRLGRKGM
eukprot:CAMPEP_0176495416 /NCGR_PEP_ID=MMETSP0200_2-20121128/10638_1 /TAXON_ID=947934 /ORGANISM="Chaetoceros sp., Strain GSL56" /LENGTH=203 /DNA_ID=CAMNT_0017893279 /DNA_START=354 /DNA_END=962 /DNA_ORIENTATION=+